MPMAAMFVSLTMAAMAAVLIVFVTLMPTTTVVFMPTTTMIVLFTTTKAEIDPGSRSAVIVRPHHPPINGLPIGIVTCEHAIAVDRLVTNAAATVVAS